MFGWLVDQDPIWDVGFFPFHDLESHLPPSGQLAASVLSTPGISSDPKPETLNWVVLFKGSFMGEELCKD